MLGIQDAIDQILTYVKGVWIKKRYVIISTWLICPIGWAYVASLPDTYQSSARLFVDTNSLLRPLLRGIAVYNNPSDQVNLVARTLFSRQNLEKIAREADLDILATTSAEMDNLIDELRTSIKLSSTRERNIYNIRYTAETPELAQKVVRITLDEFIESSLGRDRKSSDSAEEFLNQQIDEYEQRLEEAEQRLADFKINRMDRAPGSSQSYYTQLQRESAQLEQTELRLLEIESQLKAARAQMQGEAPIFGLVSPRTGSVQTTLNTKYDGRILTLESKLDELLIRYTENHPDVVKTQSLLDTLYAERNAHIEDLKEVAEDTGSYSQFGNINQNPVYQELKLSVANYENQIASLTVRRDEYRERVKQLEAMIDLVPQIEAEAQGLNRDYEITRSKYLELIQRREQAELSRKAEATSDDVQFRELDPPSLPQKPSGPNRILFYSGVLLLGFGAGLAVAFVVSQLTPIVLSANQITSTFGIPVFGSVSHTDARAFAKKERKHMLVFVASSTVILLTYIGLVGFDIVYGRLPFGLLERLV